MKTTTTTTTTHRTDAPSPQVRWRRTADTMQKGRGGRRARPSRKTDQIVRMMMRTRENEPENPVDGAAAAAAAAAADLKREQESKEAMATGQDEKQEQVVEEEKQQQQQQRRRRSCVLCRQAAMVFCSADDAALCWHCDAAVHSANFLVARHSRTFLCSICDAHISTSTSAADAGASSCGPFLRRPSSLFCASCLPHRCLHTPSTSTTFSSSAPLPSSSSSSSSSSSAAAAATSFRSLPSCPVRHPHPRFSSCDSSADSEGDNFT